MIEYINVLKSLKNLYIFDINLIKGVRGMIIVWVGLMLK